MKSGLYKRIKISPYNELGYWEVLEGFTYYIGEKDSHRLVNIPAGFITNGASIPRILHIFFTPMDTDTIPASVIHDYLYSIKWDKNEADNIFYEVMTVCRVNKFKAILFYLAVSIFGWLNYKK